MITILNRKELMLTCSLAEQVRARDILTANGIDYKIKTVNHADHNRGRTGSFGIDHDAACQYYIYVHSEDYERAKHLMKVLEEPNVHPV